MFTVDSLKEKIRWDVIGKGRVGTWLSKGETHCAIGRLSMAFDGLGNVNFIE